MGVATLNSALYLYLLCYRIRKTQLTVRNVFMTGVHQNYMHIGLKLYRIRPKKKKKCLVALHRQPLILKNWKKKVLHVQKYTAPNFQNSKKKVLFCFCFCFVLFCFVLFCFDLFVCLFVCFLLFVFLFLFLFFSFFLFRILEFQALNLLF